MERLSSMAKSKLLKAYFEKLAKDENKTVEQAEKDYWKDYDEAKKKPSKPRTMTEQIWFM